MGAAGGAAARPRPEAGHPRRTPEPLAAARLARVPFVYVLRCRDGTLYTGAARDLEARLRLHRAGRASRYTRSRLPVVLIWSRRVRTWSAALRDEHRIKSLTRTDKEALVVDRSFWKMIEARRKQARTPLEDFEKELAAPARKARRSRKAG